MEGALVKSIELRRTGLRFPFPDGLAGKLEGRIFTALSRRAKYLLMHLNDSTVLISHLGMSGSFRVEWEGDDTTPGIFHRDRSKNPRHDHAVMRLTLNDGRPVSVIYNDPRRFGFMLLANERELSQHPLLCSLGIEPTGNMLEGSVLARILQGKKTPLKAALLDQKLIAGLGNIYVCEALWRAKLSPLRIAGTIAGKEGRQTIRSERLATAIRAVIADAIAAGGSSLRDYRQADGSLGYFQHTFNVYDREGQPCPDPGCGDKVHRIVQGGRSTFFCPSCQK